MPLLTTDQRNTARRALRASGTSPRGLTDEELISRYRDITGENLIKNENVQEGPSAPADEPQGEPATLPSEERETRSEEREGASEAVSNDALIKMMREVLNTGAQSSALDEQKVVELINKHATKTVNVTVKQAAKPEVTIENAHQDLQLVVTALATRTGVALTGPAGSGKTTIAIHAAGALDLPFYSTGAVIAPYELLGTRDAHGNYHATMLRQAYEHGGVFLFDEFDACSARAICAINQLLSNHQYAFPDATVKRHPDFIFIAAMNTIGLGATRQYIGRAPLDGASLNRFPIQVDIGYDPELEKHIAISEYIANAGTDTDAAPAIKWLRVIQTARAKLTEMGSTAILSPRDTAAGAAMIAAGVPASKLITLIITKHLSEDQTKQLTPLLQAELNK